MSILSELIASKLFGGGGGGSITVDQTLNAESTNPVQNAAITEMFALTDLALRGKAAAVTVSNVIGTTPEIAAADNTIYKCGELTSLTVTSAPATGDYSIIFISGATPTVTDFPASIIFPEEFSAEANTRYEINVSDGYAVVGAWPVGA